MRVLLLDLDSKIPNLALMRIAAHHRARGDEIELRIAHNPASLERNLWDDVAPNLVYASALFSKTRPLCERLLQAYPDAIIGGTGWSMSTIVEHHGIITEALDYSVYPRYRHSIGFTQRGCRLSCEFCVVPKKEGKVRAVAGIQDIWRGDPWPREVLLLDNDFFGQPKWRDRIREIRDGGFKVSMSQGINARCLTDEAAEAIASVQYRDDDMRVPRIYTAWDSKGDEERLFAGLDRLVKYGVKPDHLDRLLVRGDARGPRLPAP